MSETAAERTPIDEAAIIQYLLGQIAILHPCEQGIDPDQPFTGLGIDSLNAVSLAGDLEERFAISLDPVEFYDHPTPSSLARMIAARRLQARNQQPAAAADAFPLMPR